MLSKDSRVSRLLYAAAIAWTVVAAGQGHAAEPKAMLEGEISPDLKLIIEQTIGSTDRPVENRFEARRRARAAAEDAIAVLRAEGYYAYSVLPDVADADPPRPLVRIMPGVRFVIRDPTLVWRGAAPDTGVVDQAVSALELPSGAPGRAADILAAEGRLVAVVQKRGYADAEAEPRDVLVDHADTSVRPTFNIRASALVHLGGLDIQGDQHTSPSYLRGLAPWKAGAIYDPEVVAELERRLSETGVYDAVTVALSPPAAMGSDGQRPVIVSLSARKHRTLEAGASYSTSEGAGVNARWTHYDRLSRADTIGLFGQVSNRDTRAGWEVSLPHWRRGQQTLKTGLQAYRVQTDAFDETGIGISADVTRRYNRTSNATLGASLDYSQTDEIRARTLTSLGRDLITIAALGDVVLDRSDDPLNPSKGWRVSGRVEPTLILGDTNLPYLRTVAQATYYIALDPEAATVIAGRLRLGRILNGRVEDIPASQRFFAGGGGSVRGFSFQGVGPRLSDNSPQGGVFLMESSLEVRRKLTSTWGMAAFVDAGAVGSGGPVDFNDLAVGAGLGVRYNLGFAPIRVDIATPLVRRRGQALFQLYVSIGQSF